MQILSKVSTEVPLVSVGMLPELEGSHSTTSVAIRQALAALASAALAACSASGDYGIITRDQGRMQWALQNKRTGLATAVCAQI